MAAPRDDRPKRNWKPRTPKWLWREFLTAEEHRVLEKIDEAKAVWCALNGPRAAITNRATQRAKAARRRRR